MSVLCHQAAVPPPSSVFNQQISMKGSLCDTNLVMDVAWGTLAWGTFDIQMPGSYDSLECDTMQQGLRSLSAGIADKLALSVQTTTTMLALPSQTTTTAHRYALNSRFKSLCMPCLAIACCKTNENPWTAACDAMLAGGRARCSTCRSSSSLSIFYHFYTVVPRLQVF